MIINARWEAECRLMRTFFPHFEPFVDSDNERHGFRGTIIGPRTGTSFEVVIVEAEVGAYPYQPPVIYIEPRPEPYLYEPGGCLSFSRWPHWNPLTDTFALQLLCAWAYFNEFDGGGRQPVAKLDVKAKMESL